MAVICLSNWLGLEFSIPMWYLNWFQNWCSIDHIISGEDNRTKIPSPKAAQNTENDSEHSEEENNENASNCPETDDKILANNEKDCDSKPSNNHEIDAFDPDSKTMEENFDEENIAKEEWKYEPMEKRKSMLWYLSRKEK